MNKALVRITRPHQDEESVAPLIRELLTRLVDEPEREGLMRTPERVSEALRFLTSGYHTDIHKLVNGALYEVKYDEMVVVKDIEFFGLCEHHLLPFFGRMHIAYLPDKKIIGLSKLPRIVNALARRLQIQERLTQEVAQTVQQIVKPLGVGVICEAKHFCMMMRGVEKQHSSAATSAMLGAFRDSRQTRNEFLALVQSSRGAA
jgi:GTP cyclohydrolase IA